MPRFLFSIALLAGALWSGQNANSIAIQQADKLFSYGEDPARDRRALDLIDQAVSVEPGKYQLLWRQARACYYIAEELEVPQKVGYYQRGINAAERAVKLEPNAVEGHFWLGANYGGAAEQKGMFKALTLISKIRSEMESVVRLSPGYEDARAFLALGELDRQLPRLIGGSVKRAISYCEQGLKLAPHNLELKLSLAQAYLDVGRREDARRQLEELLARPVDPTRARSDRGVQDQARRVLRRM